MMRAAPKQPRARPWSERPPARRDQRGFGLAELMVTLVIGMLIMGAMVLNYSSLRRTFGLQDGMAQVQDAQRMILTMLTTTVQQAGYFTTPATETRATALPTGAAVSWTGNAPSTLVAGQGVIGIGDGSGTGASSDGIAIRYQTAAGDGIMNCLGGSLAAGASAPQLWTNIYQINANNELTCSVNGAAPVTLVGNVQRMQIQYGIDLDGDGSADSYLPANIVTAGGRWADVQSVRFTFRLFDPAETTPTLLPAALVQLVDLKNFQ